MKKLYTIGAILTLLLCNFTTYSQVLTWSECDLNFAGSPSNFNYSKTFNGVPLSTTDVEVTIGFIVCQPYSSNTAGIRLNGTTFSQDNVPANSCSALFTTYTISKSVFNQAVSNGSGTIVFSYFVRDNCPSGWGCSFANDPCINFTVSYTQCTTPTTPAFAPVAPICSESSLAALPVDSTNGINGTWTPAINNSETTLYTFTPAAGQCATNTAMNIVVNPNVTPAFNQVPSICTGAFLANLPVDSTNGINGSWSPAINNSETTLYTFTPTAGQCATNTTMNITVNPIVIPVFTPVAAICSGASLADLPVDSNNGINGQWSPAINNLATTLYTFTPTTGQCAANAALSIAVNPNVTPIFTQVEPICYGETGAVLPVDSSNGINGTWFPAINNTTTTTYTFTPAAGQCATAMEMTIAVSQEVPAPTGSTTQTFCDGETVGNIIVEGNSVVWYDAPVNGNIVANSTVLSAGATYYAAQSIAACQSNNRLAVTVTNGTCLAIDTFEKGKVKLYPNPIKNMLTISNNEPMTKVLIYNELGQEVIAKTINAKEVTIDTSHLASGTYMVKIMENNTSKTMKVIKE